MQEFIFKGGENFLKIEIIEVYGFPEQTSHFGGYDIRCDVKIYVDGFSVSSQFYTTTGEIFDLFKKLKECNEKLAGKIDFANYEDELKFSMSYDTLGHVFITGKFEKFNGFAANRLNFEFQSDQSYIQSTLLQLYSIIEQYGGTKGFK